MSSPSQIYSSPNPNYFQLLCTEFLAIFVTFTTLRYLYGWRQGGRQPLNLNEN